MKNILHVLAVLFLMTISLQGAFLQKEKTEALEERKLILLTIESERCRYCKLMRKEIFDKKEYAEEIAKMYVHVYMDVRNPELPEDFRSRITPANAILSPKEDEMIDGYMGYIDAQEFVDMLKKVYETEFKGK